MDRPVLGILGFMLRLKIIGFFFSKDVLTAVLIGIAKHACHQYVETDATHKNSLPRITDTGSDPWIMEIRCFQVFFFKVHKTCKRSFFLSAV